MSHIVRQACALLAEAPARAIVHRDIKPANIHLCQRALEHDVVKILEFVLVRRLADTTAIDAVVTQPDLIIGKAAFLVPEGWTNC